MVLKPENINTLFSRRCNMAGGMLSDILLPIDEHNILYVSLMRFFTSFDLSSPSEYSPFL
ncbi:MAG: hypothetical protein RR132_05535 [Rikenellaceae bacterium]